MVWNIEPVNENDAQCAIISFVGVIIRRYELRHKCHFVIISRRVATLKEI
jgi:hypothetical protein